MSSLEFDEHVKELRLAYLKEHAETFFGSFKAKSEVARDIITELIKREFLASKKNSLERRLRSAKIGSMRPMADFDWQWPKKIPRAAIEQLLTLEFIHRQENIILLGAQGVGKTMIAKNLAHLVASSGHRSLFVTAAELVVDLCTAESAHLFKSRLSRYVTPSLLVIDEVGYLSFDSRAADVLYQVIHKRYEKNSTIITSNLAFKDWTQIFPGASSVIALVDRLAHKANVINIEADSFRLKESKQRKN